MKISIIVPVYNVASYIERCLESVYSQSYKDFEVIIIDDRGSDNSIELAQAVVKKYSEIVTVLVTNEKNEGISFARNQGIKAASGEYIFFLDSDDYLLPNAISSLVSSFPKNFFPDLAIADYKVEGNHDVGYHVQVPLEFINSNKAIRELYFSHKFFTMPWNKLINRKFIEKNDLFFQNGLIHEDNLWSFQVACYANSLAICKETTLHYVVHDNSIMSSGSNFSHLMAFYEVIIQKMRFIKDKQIHVDSKLYHFLESFKREKLMYCFWNNLPDLGIKFYYSYRKFAYPINSRLSIKQYLLELHRIMPKKIGLKYYIKCSHILI